MIKVTAYRTKTEKHLLGSNERPLLEALKSLVVYELGCGGFATEITPTRVVVETQVFHCLDTTIFEGTEKEMEPIVKVAALHTLISTENREALVHKTADVLGKLPEDARSALCITLAAPMLMGELSVKPAVMAGMGITDEKDLEAGIKLSTEDLFTVIALKQEIPDVPFRDIIAQVTPSAA